MGSFHHSFKKLGFECVFACDINPEARKNYESNFNFLPAGDIYDVNPHDLPKYDILCAGIPCQSFSTAGKKRGFKDDNGLLFFRVMDFVRINHPRIVIIENVPNLLKHNNGETFEKMRSALVLEGYNVAHKILKCSDYGIPQMRRRLFIVCVHKGTNLDNFFVLDEYLPKSPVNLSNFLNKNFEKEFAYTIRVNGRHSKRFDRHNWSNYVVDGENYTLTISDALKLQGFEDYKMEGYKTNKWRLLGNTIPTIFTSIIAQQVIKLC